MGFFGLTRMAHAYSGPSGPVRCLRLRVGGTEGL